MIEKRLHTRASIDTPVNFTAKGSKERLAGVGKDISIGGMFVQSDTPLAFGAAIVVYVKLRTAAGTVSSFELPGVVRWVRSGGMGVQFGLLGAQETHAITELSKTG